MYQREAVTLLPFQVFTYRDNAGTKGEDIGELIIINLQETYNRKALRKLPL